jgi:hypothetical protein
MSYDCFCDYDAPTFYSNVRRKARKVHKCEECRGPILPGEQYECVTGKWDYVDTFRTCDRCVDLRTWTKNNVPCLCWAHGNMHDDCREAVREAHYRAPNETQGLQFGFLRRLALIDKFNRTRAILHEDEV